MSTHSLNIKSQIEKVFELKDTSKKLLDLAKQDEATNFLDNKNLRRHNTILKKLNIFGISYV